MESIQFDGQIDLGVNIASFWNFMGVDYKFLNFWVNIEKVLILHRLKSEFFPIKKQKYISMAEII
jgi:hypothetical protein